MNSKQVSSNFVSIDFQEVEDAVIWFGDLTPEQVKVLLDSNENGWKNLQTPISCPWASQNPSDPKIK